MNTMKVPSIVKIEEDVLSALVSEVKETVATHFTVPKPLQKKKTFGVVDLWNCRRAQRTAGIIIR